MTTSRKEPEQMSVDYYQRTAHQYDAWHFEGSEHNIALTFISGLIGEMGAQSVLDTACGTGRGWLHLTRHNPALYIRGNDIALPLLRQAIEHGVPASCLEIANSEALPYRDASFDFVVELGALHHARNPETVVSEMIRVARLGIAISDSNMYVTGFGRHTLLSNSLVGSAIKLAAVRSGLLKLLKRAMYGRDYSSTEGDGIFYSTYSVFQSVDYLERKGMHVFVLPLKGTRHAQTMPLLGATHALVVSLKKPLG